MTTRPADESPPEVSDDAVLAEEAPSDLTEGTGPGVSVPAAELRDLDEPERESLAECLGRHGDGVLDALEEGHVFKVLARSDLSPQRRVVRLRRDRLADLAPYALVHLGVPIVGLARKGARLTLEGAMLVAPHAKSRVIYVDDKGTQLFLYGRHLLVRSLQHVRGNLHDGDEVIVVEDATKRCLGIGIARIDLRGADALRHLKRSPDGRRKVAAATRLDLGLYLRAQQEVPE